MQQPASASSSNKPVTPERLMQIAWGYSLPIMIEAAIKTRAFDVLDSAGALTAEQLAEKTGASARGLRMVLNALASVELLRKDAQGKYSLTPESATFLVTTKPGFQGGIFKHLTTQLIPKWMLLTDIVRSGKPATAVNEQNAGGEEFFASFVEDIFPMSYSAARSLADELKLASATTPVKVLDLAAGSGVWGIALAQKSPQVRVTAVDWAGVLPVTRRIAQKHGVADRFNYIEGDINSVNLGSGYDVATLGHILHSEGEPRSRSLLKRTFEALAPGGTIAIAEFLANDDRSGPPNAMIFAVNMLVNTERGDTFTFPEISGWLKEAGFIEPRTFDARGGPSPLILANKPK